MVTLRWEFIKENKNLTKKVIKKKESFFFFSWSSSCFLFFSCFLDRFLGRVLVFLVEFLFPCFLTFLFSFINSHLRPASSARPFPPAAVYLAYTFLARYNGFIWPRRFTRHNRFVLLLYLTQTNYILSFVLARQTLCMSVFIFVWGRHISGQKCLG